MEPMNDDRRQMFNRIVDYILGIGANGDASKEFVNRYNDGPKTNTARKEYLPDDPDSPPSSENPPIALGLPNIADNVMDEDGKLKEEFNTEETTIIEVPDLESSYTVKEKNEDGEEVEVTKYGTKREEVVSVVLDTEKLSKVTNLATAMTYAFALFNELDRVQDELDEKTKLIEGLEERIALLEREVNYRLSGN